jgi:hypothetical protein
MTKVFMKPQAGLRFATEIMRDAAEVEVIALRAAHRPLPEMPSGDRARVDALRRKASGGLEYVSWNLRGESVNTGKRAALFMKADMPGVFGSARGWFEGIRKGAAAWWLHPRYATTKGLLRVWRRTAGPFYKRAWQFRKGFVPYLKAAGAGKKGNLAKNYKWLKKGSDADKLIRSGAGKSVVKKIPLLGDGITAGSIYADERGHGSSTKTAAAAAAGGVAGSRGGAAAGALAGATAGALIGGPIGAAAGGTIGAIAGSEAGERIGHWGGKQISKVKFW